MIEHEPEPISAANRRTRIQRIDEIGRRLGFVGGIEYRHVYSQSGGAQYCVGPSADNDVLVVYAEAFERDANPDDFALEAIIAHERGHQILQRNPNFQMIRQRFPGERLEEVLASVIGSILLEGSETAQTLAWKALAGLMDLGISDSAAYDFFGRIRVLLRASL
jgi:hypothetical protein